MSSASHSETGQQTSAIGMVVLMLLVSLTPFNLQV